MNIPVFKSFMLTNAADGWSCRVIRADRVQNGVHTRTWSLAGGPQLEPSADGRVLVLPDSTTSFVLPDGED